MPGRWSLLLLVLASGLAAEDPVFRAEALNVSLRRPLGDGQPQPEHRLTLVADLPRATTILRLGDPRFAPVEADGGERLGLLVRPGNRLQHVAFDTQAGRERVLRLSLDLTPPRHLVRRLGGLVGSVEVVSGVGALRTTLMTVRPLATAAVPIEGLPGLSLRGEELGEGRLALELPAALAERCARITFTDPAGVLVPIRPAPPKLLAGGGLRLVFDLAAMGACRAAIAWHPDTSTTTLAIVIPPLDIPGGIPGLGEAAAPPPPPPPAPPPPKTPFLRAVQAGDGATLSRLLGADQRLLEAPEGDGRRPLHRAAALRQNAVLGLLLAAGADPASRSKDGLLALDLAILAGDAAGSRLLLDRGADPKAVHPTTGWSLLHRAVLADAPELVDLLLERGADPLRRATDGRSALDLARDLARWPLLRRLLGNR